MLKDIEEKLAAKMAESEYIYFSFLKTCLVTTWFLVRPSPSVMVADYLLGFSQEIAFLPAKMIIVTFIMSDDVNLSDIRLFDVCDEVFWPNRRKNMAFQKEFFNGILIQ